MVALLCAVSFGRNWDRHNFRLVPKQRDRPCDHVLILPVLAFLYQFPVTELCFIKLDNWSLAKPNALADQSEYRNKKQ